MKRGMGCGIGAWGGGGGPQCVVDVTIGQDGSVVAAVGTQDLGTGTRTYMRSDRGGGVGSEYEDVHGEDRGFAAGAGEFFGRIDDGGVAGAGGEGWRRITRGVAMAERVAPLLGADAKSGGV